MDPQIRQFKDFLQLYNTITERCFNSCVDNLLTRGVDPSEVNKYFTFKVIFFKKFDISL